MTPIKTTPKDFFFYFGALIALYASVIALLDLVFSIINYWAPDQLVPYFSASSIAWPISILIILVPVLYVLEWLIGKDIRINPLKKELWIRRWRTYLTLFLTGLTIAIDLIVLINTYLGGEISTRFVFKVLAVLIVCGAVFKYYFFSINEKYKIAKLAMKGHAWFGGILVIAAIVCGFLVVGSPAQQRAIRFDSQRINDLQAIEYSVGAYWQQYGKVPATLSDISGYESVMPKDPVTHTPYKYQTGAKDDSYKLCAVFSSQPQSQNYPTYPIKANENWNHGIGETCFDRVVSPIDYPPLKR